MSTPARLLNDQEKITLRLLVQHVARTFFDVDQVVAIDQLTKHAALKDDDLAGRIGSTVKDLSKRVGKLVNIGLIQCYSQNEQRDANTNRSTIRKYYYIDYPIFVNLVKWGIAEMRRTIDDSVRNELADKGYICPRCKTTYTMFDAANLFDPFRNAFICSEGCDIEVVDNNPDEDKETGKGQKMQRFNARSERIVSLLKKTDEMVLPKFDIATWVRNYIETQHAQALAATEAAGGATNADGTPASKSYEGLKIAGLNGTGAPTASKVSVEIIDMDEKEQLRRRREKEEENEMKRQQNALPAWYTHSTISGEVTAFGLKNDAATHPSPPSKTAALPSTTAAPVPSLSSLTGLDALVTMDDDDDFADAQSDDEVKPTIAIVVDQPKLGEATPEMRADYYAKYYANLEAQHAESSSAGGGVQSTLNPGSVRAFSSAASSPGPGSGSISSPFTHGTKMEEDSGSESESEPPMSASRKRPREDDDFADPDDQPLAIAEDENAVSAKSGVIVHVAGNPMDFSDVTDDHHDLMTPEEYEAYFEVAAQFE